MPVLRSDRLLGASSGGARRRTERDGERVRLRVGRSSEEEIDRVGTLGILYAIKVEDVKATASDLKRVKR